MVELVYLASSIVYGSLFGMMAIGLTLTYITTKVPNFAYGSFVTVGIYTSFSLYRFLAFTPYESAPVAFAIGGVVSVLMYLGILRPLARRGSPLVSLMIATLAIDIAFIGIFGIYANYLRDTYNFIDSLNFTSILGDFSLFGEQGLVYTAPISLALITVGLFLLLTRTKFGVAMRASVENPSLARVLGIDVERVYVFAWFLAGGFAGMSGSFYTLYSQGGIATGSGLIVEIFAASVLGGLSSIYGATLGGVIIGAGENLLTGEGINLFGTWVLAYQKGIPLLIMIATLLLLPQGLASLRWTRRLRMVLVFLNRVARTVRLRLQRC
jgi:branched-chain amino acid transport system permease protein